MLPPAPALTLRARLPALGLLIAGDGVGSLLLLVRFYRALISRGGPAAPAPTISGALAIVLLLVCRCLIVSSVRCTIMIVVFQKGVSPHQNQHGASR